MFFSLSVLLLLLSTTFIHSAPPGWICDVEYYNASDGCDCLCGVPDPDCEIVPVGPIYNCPEDFDFGFAIACNASSMCVYNETIPQPPTPPPSWVCDAEYYGAWDGCDCNCGALDLDCLDPYLTPEDVYNCPLDDLYGEAISCDDNGLCVYNTSKTPEIVVPAEWTCEAEYYDNYDGCDCDCGAFDPDCLAFNDSDIIEVYNCPTPAHTCSPEGFCVRPPQSIPDEWTCPETNYNATDGCDCDCGAFDPDCLIPYMPIWNCPCPLMGCSVIGECYGECNGTVYGLGGTSNGLPSSTLWILVAFLITSGVINVLIFIFVIILIVICILNAVQGRKGPTGRIKDLSGGERELEATDENAAKGDSEEEQDGDGKGDVVGKYTALNTRFSSDLGVVV